MAETNQKIKIVCTEREDDLHFFDIDCSGILISINCYLFISSGILHMRETDIEGPGINFYGTTFRKTMKEISKEFCFIYNCHTIEIKGAPRSAGRTKGRILNTITFVFDDLKN